MSPFQALPGTRFARRHDADPSRHGDVRELRWNYARGSATYRHTPPSARAYRRERARVLHIVHRINARPLRNQALEFDGV
jgi:anaerobic magnesium-protoporphyrin IX monomethyl ester cyclase